MNLFKTFLYSLLYCISNTSGEISYLDYALVHKDNYRFSTAFDNNFIIETLHDVTTCKNNCNKNYNCKGLVTYFNDSELHCNTLTDVGNITYNIYNSTSYKKIIRYKDDNQYNLYGVVETSGDEYNNVDVDVYIDLNHNGIHESNEPITRTVNGNFKFLNISKGKYLIREIKPKECIQLIPGVMGSPSQYTGNGYIDNIYKIYKDHHKLEGGIINSTSASIIPRTNFILGNKPNKYLTFYPNDELIVTFIDESVVDYKGDDIIINLYEYNENRPHIDTKAHVSVSNNGLNYTYLGILDDDHYKFDLNNIKYNGHVSYLKLHFFGGNKGLNIVSIYGSSSSLYSPSYGHYINVPLGKKKTK